MITGIVEKTYEKEWDGRNGPITLHSFQLRGDSRYYRTGERPLVKKGQAIGFDADKQGNVDFDTLSDVDPDTVEVPKPKQGYQARKTGNNFAARAAARDEYWERKEARDAEIVEPRITWSSAQSDAVDLVSAALQHDLLSFGNANKGAKLGLLLDYVDQVTARFATQRYNAADLLKDALADAERGSRPAKRNEGDDDLE